MPAPTNLIITYTGGSGSPQTYTLPTPDGTNPIDYTLAVLNIQRAGGFWYHTGDTFHFVPFGQITSITAQ